MQPVVFPESGELVINDFTESGSDDLVVVDLESGELLDRVQTGSRIANGMFLSPDSDSDGFYCSTLGIAQVAWH
jgi:16S rRNA C967 or C1407 C5-methylase (RsmB/RsmF family)